MIELSTGQISRLDERVGSYHLVGFIGAGGMGEVYEGRHTVVGTRQAIKFLRSELARVPELCARFEREARIAGQLENKHIVPVRDFGRAADGTPYMVMDLVDGWNLAKILAKHGPLKPARAADLVRQACLGVEVAHAHNVIHRDLKPENLHVCPQDDGTELLKVLDFGIAKLLCPDAAGPTTQTGNNLGTPYYMSPEQAQGLRDLDRRTDIYALGVVLYEILSGAKPHPGDSHNAILFHIVTQDPVPLESRCPEIPGDFAKVVRRAMARDPADRFQSVAELAGALVPFREGNSASAGPEILLRPAAAPRGSDVPTLVSGSEDSAPRECGPAWLQASASSTPVVRRAVPDFKPHRPWWTQPIVLAGYSLAVAVLVTAGGLSLMRVLESQPALSSTSQALPSGLASGRPTATVPAASSGMLDSVVTTAKRSELSNGTSNAPSTVGQVNGQYAASSTVGQVSELYPRANPTAPKGALGAAAQTGKGRVAGGQSSGSNEPKMASLLRGAPRTPSVPPIMTGPSPYASSSGKMPPTVPIRRVP